MTYTFLLLPGTNDFTSINNQDVGPFSNMTRRQCFAIEITNDMIREEIESFFLDLTTPVMLDRVMIDPAVAEVTIIEDDRESSSNVFPQHNKSHDLCSLL